MDQDDIEHIYRLSKDKIEETDMSLKRYSYDSIDWKDRLVGLRGARGVGKTTLLLQKIADSGEEPQTPKMKLLYDQLDTERQHGLKILYALERAALLRLLPSSGESLKNLASPEKIYCDNTNLMYAIIPDADIGTARETFFMNQVGSSHVLTYPKKGDFLVDGKYLFEVGGKGKTFRQIKDLPDSFVVNDGIEVGIGNKIPLWLFGFLY